MHSIFVESVVGLRQKGLEFNRRVVWRCNTKYWVKGKKGARVDILMMQIYTGGSLVYLMRWLKIESSIWKNGKNRLTAKTFLKSYCQTLY